MKGHYLFFTALLALTASQLVLGASKREIKAIQCDDTKIEFDGKTYRKDYEVITTSSEYTEDLVVNWFSGNVYFTQKDSKASDELSLWVIKQGSKTALKIPMPSNGAVNSLTVDRHNGNVYVVSSLGIYKLDENDFSLHEFALGGTEISFIEVADGGKTIYATRDSDDRVLVSTDSGKTFELSEKLPIGLSITADDDNNVFFITYAFDAFVLRKGETTPVLLNREFKDKNFLDYTIRNDGSAYVVPIREDGKVYKINVGEASLKEVAHLGYQIYGVGFDVDNNVYFCANGKIVKYVPCA